MPLVERGKNIESFNAIKNFLDGLRQGGLGQKPTWTPEEALKVQTLSRQVISVLPESIKTIVFPNGGKIIFGEDDPVRVVSWDLMDIKKYAERLAKISGF